MAKRVNEQNVGPDKGGMRILYVELNGSNASLQEGLRTLVAAMNKPMQVAVPSSRRLVANENLAPTPSQDLEADLFNQEATAVESAEVDHGEAADQSPNGPTRRKRGEGANRDRNAGLAILKTLDLHPEGKASLKAYVAEKKPKTQEEHIAVYIYYLKNVLELADVGFSHIFTCFKESGERMPADLQQSCRNAASKKGWIDTANADDLKHTTRGDNFVEKDLPRIATNGDDGAK